MKHPIAWHEECLRNYKLSLKRREIQLLDLQETAAHMKLEVEWYEKQIVRAKSMGKDGFDSERFGVERNKK